MGVVELDDRTAERRPADSLGAPVPLHRQLPKRRRALRFAALVLVVIAGTVGAASWLTDSWAHVYVSDSRIGAAVVTVSSEASGRVTALPVAVGERVRKGDLLARLDSRAARLRIDELDAELARLDAEANRLRAHQDMLRTQLASQLRAAQGQLAAAEAADGAARAELESARGTYDRVASLYRRGVAAVQRYDDARAAFRGAEERKHRTAADVETARADVAVAEAGMKEVIVVDRQLDEVEAQKRALNVRRDEQLIDLGQREIHAAFDGVVDQTFVDVGEYVSPGTRLLMYHDPNDIWVDANVKETEFRRLRIGAPVTVTVDAYPSRDFAGEVIRLGQAATSEFALLPSPNPSGNFTKVTQRLPVRIAIEQEDGLLRPGMMVEVAIDVVD